MRFEYILVKGAFRAQAYDFDFTHTRCNRTGWRSNLLISFFSTYFCWWILSKTQAIFWGKNLAIWVESLARNEWKITLSPSPVCYALKANGRNWLVIMTWSAAVSMEEVGSDSLQKALKGRHQWSEDLAINDASEERTSVASCSSSSSSNDLNSSTGHNAVKLIIVRDIGIQARIIVLPLWFIALPAEGAQALKY